MKATAAPGTVTPALSRTCTIRRGGAAALRTASALGVSKVVVAGAPKKVTVVERALAPALAVRAAAPSRPSPTSVAVATAVPSAWVLRATLTRLGPAALPKAPRVVVSVTWVTASVPVPGLTVTVIVDWPPSAAILAGAASTDRTVGGAASAAAGSSARITPAASAASRIRRKGRPRPLRERAGRARAAACVDGRVCMAGASIPSCRPALE